MNPNFDMKRKADTSSPLFLGLSFQSLSSPDPTPTLTPMALLISQVSRERKFSSFIRCIKVG